MNQSVGLVALVVHDYDEALAFFVGKLGFELVEDTFVPAQNKRWVVVKPAGSSGANVLLARASDDEQRACIGRQAGGRVAFFLYTDDFERDYVFYRSRQIAFAREPEQQPHGRVAVFLDLYGNPWDLIEPNQANRSWP